MRPCCMHGVGAVAVALAACVLSGCGGGATPADAGTDAVMLVDAGGVVTPAAPTPPAPTAPPVLTPCPTGWREAHVGSDPGAPTACEPWPGDAPEDCTAPDEAHFAGEPGCVRIGTACPTGDFADGLPTTGSVLYVLAGAPSGGSGTLASPFATVGEALAVATPGTVVALSKGTFTEATMVPTGVTLWGACVAGTTLTSTAPDAGSGTVWARGMGIVVRNLTLSGVTRAVYVTGAASIDLEDVVATGAGLAVTRGASFTGHSVLVRDAAIDATTGEGVALAVDGATATLTRAVLLRATSYAVLAQGAAAHVRLEDVAAVHNLPQGTQRGEGVQAFLGATVDMVGSVVDGYGDGAISSVFNATVNVTDSILRNHDPSVFEIAGVMVLANGTAVLSRTRIEHAASIGASVSNPDTNLELDDVVVDAMQGDAQGDGISVYAMDHSHATLARVWLDGARMASLVSDTAQIDAHDVTIRDVLPDATGQYGVGLQAFDGANVTVQGLDVSGARYFGAAVQGAAVTLDDVVIRDTGPSPPSTDTGGYGLQASLGAQLTVARVRLSGNHATGLLADGAGTSVAATDLEIDDTQGATPDGTRGYGICLTHGASATVQRALLGADRTDAVAAFDSGTTATLSDVVVRDTRAADCGASSCMGSAGGSGVASFGAAVDLTTFDVESSTLCALQLARDGSLDAHDGYVHGNAVGACVEVAGYDTGRLFDRVVYEGNTTNLESTTLTVPDSSPVLTLPVPPSG